MLSTTVYASVAFADKSIEAPNTYQVQENPNADESMEAPNTSQVQEKPRMLKAAIIDWRYKTENGNLYRRQYNYSTGAWVGDWELCP